MRKLRWTALGFTLVLVVSLFASTAAALPNLYYDIHVVVTGNGDAWTMSPGPTPEIPFPSPSVPTPATSWRTSPSSPANRSGRSPGTKTAPGLSPAAGLMMRTGPHRTWDRTTPLKSTAGTGSPCPTMTSPSGSASPTTAATAAGPAVPATASPMSRPTPGTTRRWTMPYPVVSLDGVSKTNFDPDGAVTRAMTWLVLGACVRQPGPGGLQPLVCRRPGMGQEPSDHRRQEPHRRSHPAGAYHHALPLVWQPQGFRLAGRLSRRGPRRLLGEGRHGLALREGLVGIGSSTLAPDRVTTRAELAVVLQRLNNL